MSPLAVVTDRSRRANRARPRQGVALLAALWLVVMIASAGLEFALVARERRALGLTSADRGRDTAALDGALAQVQARLERDATREAARPGRSPGPARRSGVPADPWRDLPERFAAPLRVGDLAVTVQPTDLGTVLNVNLASETELATLIAAVQPDAPRAAALAQAILDWRDADDLPRRDGAEGEQYRRAGRPVPPANGAFQSLDDLQDVWGMTPELLARLRPYLTVDGAVRRLNVNAAPAALLRTLPGMTEPLLATVLALRNRGRRVESIPALLSAVQNAGIRTGRTGGAGDAESAALTRALSDALTLDTRDVAVVLTVAAPVSAQPARLTAVLHRDDDGTTLVQGRRW